MPGGPRTFEELRIARPIVEPAPWPFDACVRREAVLDPDDGRLIRRVGWVKCLRCLGPMFSEDVARVRMHPACRQEEPGSKPRDL